MSIKHAELAVIVGGYRFLWVSIGKMVELSEPVV